VRVSSFALDFKSSPRVCWFPTLPRCLRRTNLAAQRGMRFKLCFRFQDFFPSLQILKVRSMFGQSNHGALRGTRFKLCFRFKGAFRSLQVLKIRSMFGQSNHAAPTEMSIKLYFRCQVVSKSLQVPSLRPVLAANPTLSHQEELDSGVALYFKASPEVCGFPTFARCGARSN
jgi:hypothetical protein